jgi:hypothetical protein
MDKTTAYTSPFPIPVEDGQWEFWRCALIDDLGVYPHRLKRTVQTTALEFQPIFLL